MRPSGALGPRRGARENAKGVESHVVLVSGSGADLSERGSDPSVGPIRARVRSERDPAIVAPMLTLDCFQVDAFTRTIFSGNPAAVCPLDDWLEDATLQAIAAENALSETAFVLARDDGEFELRWFTPEVEVDLCGHATLAAAFVLMTELGHGRGRLRFHSKSGALDVRRAGDALTLDFPKKILEPKPLPEAFGAALGAEPTALLAAGEWVAVYEDAETLRSLRPDFGKLASLDTPALCVTAPGTAADADVDFVSRFFAPRQGIPEDPVTGSAHCFLAPYWANRLGKTALRARQVSRRSGEIDCEVTGERVHLTGHAVLVKRGTFLVPR